MTAAFGELYAIVFGGTTATLYWNGGVESGGAMPGVTPSIIGSWITVSGAAYPGNNGFFPITGWLSSTQIYWNNAFGTAGYDANNGHIVWTIAPHPLTAATPGTYYKIPWNGLGASSNTTPSNSTYDITVGATGAYNVRAAFQFEPSFHNGGPFDIAIFVNGTKQPEHITTQFQDVEVVVEGVYQLNSGDVVDVRITDTFAGDTNCIFTIPHGGSFVVSIIN